MARLMIVDDAMLARRLLKTTLTAGGHEVAAEVASGEEALSAYREHQPDLVLMDINLPGISGIDALRQILKADAAARVVMVTSVTREQTVREAVAGGAAAYVVKPYTSDRILSVLETVLVRSPEPSAAEPPTTDAAAAGPRQCARRRLDPEQAGV